MKRSKLNTNMAKIILALAWPTMAEQLLSTAVQYIDTAMVGSLGTMATAAVGSTTTVNWLVGSVLSAMGVGFVAMISQAMGANEKEKVKRISSQAVFVVIMLGVLTTAVTLALSGVIPKWMQVEDEVQPVASKYFFVLYIPMLARTAITVFGAVLRSSGNTKTPLKVGIIVNMINVIFNFFFIYQARCIEMFGMKIFVPGAGMGVIGAAAASAIAFTVGGALISIAVWKDDTVSPKGYSIKPDKTILNKCFKIAVPNMFQQFATCLGYVAFASMINSVGRVATATHTIANTVESAFYIPGYGMKTAAATLAGNAYGARDKKRMEEIVKMFIPIEIGLMIISGGLLFSFAEPLMSIFSKDAEVIRLGTTVLRMVALSEPFYGFTIIIDGLLQGVGKTKITLVLHVLAMWLVRIVGTFICIHMLSLGLVSAWACMILHKMELISSFLDLYIKKIYNPIN